MSKLIKILAINGMIFLSLFLCSCDSYVKVNIQEDGAVAFGFSGTIGKVFEDIIGEDGEDFIDKASITSALTESGFSKVKVASQNKNVRISFEDKNKESYLFKTGITTVKNNEIKLNITAEKFLELYNSAGEDIQGLLDVFLSPVLSNEEMSEDEYIDMIKVTYGEEFGEEIEKSVVHFVIKDKNGKEKKKDIFVKSILCGTDISI